MIIASRCSMDYPLISTSLCALLMWSMILDLASPVAAFTIDPLVSALTEYQQCGQETSMKLPFGTAFKLFSIS